MNPLSIINPRVIDKIIYPAINNVFLPYFIARGTPKKLPMRSEKAIVRNLLKLLISFKSDSINDWYISMWM